MLLRPKCPICHRGTIICEQKFTVTRILSLDSNGKPCDVPSEETSMGRVTNVTKCNTCNRKIPRDRVLKSIERHIGSIENISELQRREQCL